MHTIIHLMFLRNNKASVARAKRVVGTVSGEDREVDRGSIMQDLVDTTVGLWILL